MSRTQGTAVEGVPVLGPSLDSRPPRPPRPFSPHLGLDPILCSRGRFEAREGLDSWSTMRRINIRDA